MIQPNPKPVSKQRWTAAQLRRLSESERDAILRAVAADAEHQYRRNPELSSSEAFGRDDLHGESSSSETR